MDTFSRPAEDNGGELMILTSCRLSLAKFYSKGNKEKVSSCLQDRTVIRSGRETGLVSVFDSMFHRVHH